MVAVFQNLDNGSFARISNPTTNRDFDAGQTNPTAIALLSLTASTTDPWDDIVVTNNDNDDPRDPSHYLGTVSVLQPAAVPTLTTTRHRRRSTIRSASLTRAPINNLTVTLDLTDQQSVANLQCHPGCSQRRPVHPGENQIDASGTAHDRSRAFPAATRSEWLGYTTGATGAHGIDVGTIFDDNATRNIFDADDHGDQWKYRDGLYRLLPARRGQPGEFPRFDLWRPTSTVQWTLVDHELRLTSTSTAPAFGNVKNFSLQFSTGMTTEYAKSHRHDPRRGRARQYLSAQAAIVAQHGVGPGLVLAIDNTLGSDSPYQGRIYAAYVGYDRCHRLTGSRIPTTNTDIFLKYSDNGGLTWSTAGRGQRRQCGYRRLLRASSDIEPTIDQVTGRTQFQPAIAVDQATGTLVIYVARRPQRRGQRPGRHLHHHQHRRRQYLQRPDLRQPVADRDRRHHRPDRCLGPEAR